MMYKIDYCSKLQQFVDIKYTHITIQIKYVLNLKEKDNNMNINNDDEINGDNLNNTQNNNNTTSN